MQAQAQGAASTAATAADGVASDDASQWQWLLVITTILFFSALVAGLLPLAFIKVRWMNKITALGAGLCIGASLALMLPESFHLLFEAHEKYGFNPGVGGLFLTLGVISFLLLEALLYPEGHHHHHDSAGLREHGGPCCYGSNKDERVALSDSQNGGGHLLASHLHLSSTEKDKLSDCCSSDNRCKDGVLPEHALSVQGSGPRHQQRRGFKGWSTVAFMVLHACTDGLVLGSVAATGHQEMSLVVSMAMVAHKVPAAFSLCAYLMALRWRPGRALKSMLAFAVATPLAAILFYSIKYAISAAAFEKSISLAMLFSSGSIMYVGFFHMLPEALKANQGGISAGGSSKKSEKFDVLLLVTLGSVSAACFGFIPHDH